MCYCANSAIEVFLYVLAFCDSLWEGTMWDRETQGHHQILLPLCLLIYCSLVQEIVFGVYLCDRKMTIISNRNLRKHGPPPPKYGFLNFQAKSMFGIARVFVYVNVNVNESLLYLRTQINWKKKQYHRKKQLWYTLCLSSRYFYLQRNT